MIRQTFGRFLGQRDGGQRDGDSAPVSFADAKQLVRSKDPDVRRTVALDPETRPELLYFLARDISPGVRAAVAAHRATPRQADLILAVDENPDIRTSIAEKVTSQLHSLPQDEAAQVWQLTVSVLDALARDDLTRVRQLVAETARGLEKIPRTIAITLARDIEPEVAIPALGYPGQFGDEELVEIVRGATDSRIVTAVARRPSIGASVADAIVERGDEAPIAALLANKSIAIRPRTMQRVASHEASPVAPTPISGDVIEPYDDASARASRIEAQQGLTEDMVIDALASDIPFAVAALALRARIAEAVVRKIFRSHSAKGLVSIAWRAGFGMRLALQLQVRVGRLPPKARLIGSGDGWPLAADEMAWQIEFFRTLVPGA